MFPFTPPKAPLIVYNSYVMEEVRGRGFNTDTGNKEETMTATGKSVKDSMTSQLRSFHLF